MKTTQTTITRMNRWIDDHQEQIISELQAFCRLRSVSRSDLALPGAPFGPEMRQMLNFALMRGASYGFDVINHEGYCGSVLIGRPNNAIGIFGHLDVVPEGDGWIYPPYGATRAGEFLIGRGVSDNKFACVMGLMLMRMIKDLHLSMRHGIRLVFGCSEETGMLDMEYFVKTQISPEVSLVPDMRFPVNYAQKGMMRALLSRDIGDGDLVSFDGGEVENMVPPFASAIVKVPLEKVEHAFLEQHFSGEDYRLESVNEGTKITAVGFAAHAAGPENGRSAILMLSHALLQSGLIGESPALETLKRIEDACKDYHGRQMGIDGGDVESGVTTIVVGVAKTTDGKLFVNVDSRISTAADLDQIEENFTSYCERQGFVIEKIKIGKAFHIDKDDPRVLALMDVYQEMTGDIESQPYVAGGGTYSRVLEDAITFGPGFPEAQPRPDDLPTQHGGAHAPDEYIHIPTMLRGMKIYAAALLELDQLA